MTVKLFHCLNKISSVNSLIQNRETNCRRKMSRLLCEANPALRNVLSFILQASLAA